jgi:hypothetical protein
MAGNLTKTLQGLGWHHFYYYLVEQHSEFLLTMHFFLISAIILIKKINVMVIINVTVINCTFQQYFWNTYWDFQDPILLAPVNVIRQYYLMLGNSHVRASARKLLTWSHQQLGEHWNYTDREVYNIILRMCAYSKCYWTGLPTTSQFHSTDNHPSVLIHRYTCDRYL